jgi:NitT/TauT family transport system substrate-binding protein
MKSANILASIALSAMLTTSAWSADVKVGVANAISDAGFFIAKEKGYFKDEGLSVEIIPFTSGANMVAPLGSGQLDAGGGSAAAGFYNAYARGIKMKIVADKASSIPGYPVNRLVVRSDLVQSGRFKTLADLKGMKLAMNAPGVAAQVTLDLILKKAGLSRSDIETVNMSMPDYVAALNNKAVDASLATEPFGSLSIRDGKAVAIVGDDEIVPGHQIANLLYSEKFASDRSDDAVRFMKAYLRGLRFYAGALANGRFQGPNASEVIAILMKATPIKDPEIFKAIIPSGVDINGAVNAKTLKLDLDNYKQAGLILGKVDVEDVIDTRFLDAALKDLGQAKAATP